MGGIIVGNGQGALCRNAGRETPDLDARLVVCWLVGHDNHVDVNDVVDDTVACNGFLKAVERLICLETKEVVVRGHAGCVESDIHTRGLILRICIDRTESNGTEVNFSTVLSVSVGSIKIVGGGTCDRNSLVRSNAEVSLVIISRIVSVWRSNTRDLCRSGFKCTSGVRKIVFISLISDA